MNIPRTTVGRVTSFTIVSAICASLTPGCSKAVGRISQETASSPTIARSLAPSTDTPPVQIVTPRSVVVKDAQMGALERPLAMRRFFEALNRLEGGQGHDDVRVVQFGDSHTAADYETGAIRKALQGRFGDGGRGFVAVGQPWKKYVQDGVRTGMTKEWTPERGKLVLGKFVGDGCYGLGGVCLLTSKRGARAWLEASAVASQIEIAFLEQPQGGSFEVFVDGTRNARITTRGAQTVSAWKSFTVPEGPHKIEVRAGGDGDVRVFGATLDRARIGIVYDAIGVNGARASIALQYNEGHMAEQLKHRAPDLVVLAYGTNESVDDASAQTYERHLVDVLGRVARAVPMASCLLLGPPDRAIETKDGWETSPRMFEIVAVQRRVAEAAGCAFYDQMAAMGGDGSMAAWAEEDPPRAARDRVHLTRDGYAAVGTTFANDLLRAYSVFRADRGLTPTATAASHRD